MLLNFQKKKKTNLYGKCLPAARLPWQEGTGHRGGRLYQKVLGAYIYAEHELLTGIVIP